jgi:hypothetical protein
MMKLAVPVVAVLSLASGSIQAYPLPEPIPEYAVQVVNDLVAQFKAEQRTFRGREAIDRAHEQLSEGSHNRSVDPPTPASGSRSAHTL